MSYERDPYDKILDHRARAVAKAIRASNPQAAHAYVEKMHLRRQIERVEEPRRNHEE